MRKFLKFILSFFLILLISGCGIINGTLTPGVSSSSFTPNFPIFGSSVSSSSTSSSTVKPSTSSSSSVKPSTSSSTSKPTTSSSSSVKPTTSSPVSSSTIVTDQITPISQIINEAQYNLDASKIYTAEGIVVARDNKNRPYIMDDNGDVILIYNYSYNLEIGDRIRVKGTIDVYNDLIEFSNSGIQSLEILARGVSFAFPNVDVEYTADGYINDSGIHSNGQLIKLANVSLHYNGKIIFTDSTSQKVRAYNNLDDYPYLNYETSGNEYNVYGFYYGKSTSLGKICIAWVQEIEHKHNYKPRITWHVDWAHPADFEVSCECGEITYDYSSWTEEIERKEATCTQEGYITYRGYINYNGELYYEDQIKYLPPLYHDYQPRFTWTGDLAVPVVMDMVCSYDETHTVNNLDSTMRILEKVDPTCDSYGYMICEGIIEYNGNTYSEQRWIDIPATGHDYVDTVIEPTKDGEGYTNHKCNNCGYEYRDNYKNRKIYVAPNDDEAPILTLYSVDKEEYNVGDVVYIEFAIDDESSIESTYIQFRSYSHVIGVSLYYVRDNIFAGEIYIGEEYLNSTYYLDYTWITDYLGNYDEEGFIPDLSFKVNNPNSSIIINPDDTTSPQVLSFSMDKNEVNVGDTINFKLEIEDESSLYEKWLQFNCYAHHAGVDLTHIEGNVYEGGLYIDESFLNGTYQLNYMSICDYLGNYSDQYNEPITFKVNNPNSTVIVDPNDSTVPNIISFSIDKNEVHINDIVRVEFIIEDASSIYELYMEYSNEYGTFGTSLQHIEGNLYANDIYIPEYYLGTTCTVSYIYICDYAGNASNPTIDLSFEVLE